MCGFAGEFLFPPGRADLELASRMAQRLAHRGPDESGCYLSPDGRCAMGFRRLAVIDPPGSHQPMTTADGRFTVAFNGEIYNFATLRRELADDGAAFATAGDTEVLLHLYARRGAGMLERLDGMFAFALYDSAEARLFLARDRLGQKPLWYALLGDRIVFASEAKALLAHPGVPAELDKESIYLYVSIGYVPAPRSAWAAIRKLPPAHHLSVPPHTPTPHRYWAPPPSQPPEPAADPVRAVRQALDGAVRARLISDVPLGALLSGGVDSAIVVALMSRAVAPGAVRTFTAGFEDDEYDERPAARQVARHCRTQHTELLVRPDPTDLLDRVVALFDEPFADSSALPTWLICRAAREHVTVALTGDGGDEVFAGYDRYRAMRLAETMGPGRYMLTRLAALLLSPWAPADERSRLRRFLRFAQGLTYPFASQYFLYRRLFAPEDLPRLFTPEFTQEADLDAPARWFCDLYESAEFDSEVAAAQRHDLLTYLPDDLLVKADIASMAGSLELRAPMLDHRVVELGLSLPVEWKVRGRRGKRILRDAFADLLPPSVWARKKRGFAVPLARWLREDLRATLVATLLDPQFLDQGVFRKRAVAGLINDHLSGRYDHQHRLWALLVFARWLAAQRP